jgi:hypothetical protein
MKERAPAATGELRRTAPGRRRRKPPRDLDFHTYVEDPRLVELRAVLLKANDFSLFKTSELADVFWHLRDYTYFCGVQGQYEEALRCEQLAADIHLELDDRGICLLTNKVAKAFQHRVQEKEKEFVSIRSSDDCEFRNN